MRKDLSVLACILTLAMTPVAASAQENPVTSLFRQAIARQERNLAAGAEEMPADKYAFKPTPEQMSFGRMVLHVAQSSSFACSRVSGEQAPSFAGLTENSPKEKLVAAMKSAFQFCDQALAKLNDSDLSAQMPWFGGRNAPKIAAFIELTDDLADHYSQEAIYLRLNGHLPPTARRGARRGQGGL